MNSYVTAGLNAVVVVGAIDTVILLLAIFWTIALWARGILPAILRLGNGLAKRKIAIFAKNDNLTSLRHLLTDSQLFRKQ